MANIDNNLNDLDIIILSYIKSLYPIKKYKKGRRFVKGIIIENNIFTLSGETRKKLYYLMLDDLKMCLGVPEEKIELALLMYLKFY